MSEQDKLLSTGIEGLDVILAGGLLPGRLYLIARADAEITANSFLRHMVRSLVGTMVALRGPKGSASFPVAPDVKDLESVKVGDRVSIVYSQALALQMEAQPAAQKPAAKKS